MITGKKYKELVDSLSISVSKLEKTLGVSHARISNAIKRDSDISLDIVELTVKEFPQVNEHWLRTGEGSMFNNGASNEPEEGYTSAAPKKGIIQSTYDKLMKLLLLDDEFDEDLRKEAREHLKKLDVLIKKNEDKLKNG